MYTAQKVYVTFIYSIFWHQKTSKQICAPSVMFVLIATGAKINQINQQLESRQLILAFSLFYFGYISFGWFQRCNEQKSHIHMCRVRRTNFLNLTAHFIMKEATSKRKPSHYHVTTLRLYSVYTSLSAPVWR